MKLRPHQREAVDSIMAELAFGATDLFLRAPPAFGKSLVLSTLAKELDGTVVIMVNISALLMQIADHLDEIGQDYSILKSGMDSRFDPSKKVQLVMSHTYYSRADKISLNCNYICIDEGDREYASARTTKLIQGLKPDGVIRVSGTPWDSQGYEFDGSEIIETVTTQELEDNGWLTPVKYFIPQWSEKVNYSKLKTSTGDYNSVELDDIVSGNAHMNMIVKSMNEIGAKDKKTLVFASSIEQANLLTEKLRANGYKARAYHSKINKKLNDATMEAFKHDTKLNLLVGEKTNTGSLFEGNDEHEEDVKVLVSISKIGIGFDCPSVELGVLCRPTKILSLYIQIVSRVIRKHKRKDFAEILDCAQLVGSFGFHTDHYVPLKRTGNPEVDKAKKMALEQTMGLSHLSMALDDELQEFDLSKYELKIEKLEKAQQEVKKKNADITTWDLKRLASIFDYTDDVVTIIKIGAEIQTRKAGRPISKSGFEYDYNVGWLSEDIVANIKKYPDMKRKWTAAYRTRVRNIIKQGKNFNSVKFFADFLLKNYEAEMEIVDYSNSCIREPRDGLLPAIDIDISDIPF